MCGELRERRKGRLPLKTSVVGGLRHTSVPGGAVIVNSAAIVRRCVCVCVCHCVSERTLC